MLMTKLNGKTYPAVMVVETEHGPFFCDRAPFEEMAERITFDRHGIAEMETPAAMRLLEQATAEMKLANG